MNLDVTAEIDLPRPAVDGDVDDPGDRAETGDGRRARRERNMASVVEALLALFAEGQLHPTAQQLAHRSGVSLRSVFRYFDDMQDLTLQAVTVHFERVAPLYDLPPRPEGASLHERIATIAEHRARIYSAVAPVARAAALRYHRSPDLAELSEGMRRQVLRQTAEYFAPELDPLPEDERRLVLACLDAAGQFATAENHCVRHGLPTERLSDAYRLAMTRLLAPYA